MPKKRPNVHNWARHDDEPEHSYAYFLEYLKLSPPRKISVLAPMVGQSARTLYSHSSKWNWQHRADKWDQAQAEVETKAILDERAKMARDHLRLLNKARMLADRHLESRLDLLDDDAKLGDVVRLMDKAITLERLVMGEATARVEQAEAWDLESLDEDELELLAKLQAKATKK